MAKSHDELVSLGLHAHLILSELEQLHRDCAQLPADVSSGLHLAAAHIKGSLGCLDGLTGSAYRKHVEMPIAERST